MGSIKNSIIVPAYNEEKGLPVVIKDLKNNLNDTCEILVIDDGSSDRTCEKAVEMGCRVISHNLNQGKGSAMRTGVKYSLGENVIFIDADGTYPASAIPEIIKLLEQNDMVVAHRHTESNINPLNRLGNWVFGKMMKILYKSKVFDPLSGLYGIRKDKMEMMGLHSQGFEIETELTIKAAQMRLKVNQISIQYDPRIGETKLRPFYDGWRILKTIFIFLFLYNPTMVLTAPGFIFFLAALGLNIALLPGPFLYIGGISLSYHTSIFASMISLIGFQLIVFGIAAKMYSVLHKYAKPDFTTKIFAKKRFINMFLIIGFSCIIIALGLGVHIFLQWAEANFSDFFELQKAIFMFFLLSFGVQSIFSIIFLSIFFREIRRMEMENSDSQVRIFN